MTPDIVVDIGNSRMKWGLCAPDVVEMVSLPLDDLNPWDDQAEKWWTEHPTRWAVGGVNPKRVEQFLKWRKTRGGSCVQFERYDQLPIKLNVETPDAVGLDRLFGAIAARKLTPPGEPCVTVDVGTAATVNLIDADGMFQGGAIFPGPRLMTESLFQNTAKLPSLDIHEVPAAAPPGRTTPDAIRAGIAAAVQGGVGLLVSRLAAHHPFPHLFLTGGGRGSLSKYGFMGVAGVTEIPHLTLEGIRLAAEAMG